jgi:LAS superfamily LD-carboxypeptidase LdcB
MIFEQLTGQSKQHLAEIFPGHFLHTDVVEPYARLVRQAAEAGIDLRLASGYRSFKQQLTIWNDKACGRRPVYDDTGRAIAMDGLKEREKIAAILRWSSLPGASRHHWGTDVDVWDTRPGGPDYRVKLVSQEFSADGIFSHLSGWLDEVLSTSDIGFFRPYAEDAGGIAPEPWHLSFRPVARNFEKQLGPEILRRALVNADMACKQTVIANIDEIYQRYVRIDVDLNC